MSVRQYIGARYVTKIYENSLDPSLAEWEASVNYEPLTMVTYNYGSYLSKKEVPASIGNPADNPTYWVQTGFYNGQISSLQNQINDINSEFLSRNTMINRKIIFIGDSYGVGYNPDELNVVGWIDKIISMLGLSNTQYIKSAASGYGFANANGTFLSLLQGITISDPDSITDIIVCGGINDGFIADNDLIAAISTFISYANTNFPNALIHIGYIGGSRDLSIHGTIAHTAQIYKNCAATKNSCYISNSENILAWKTDISSDNVHPLQSGYDKIAKYLINYLYNGSIEVTEDNTVILSVDDASPLKKIALELSQRNDEFIIQLTASFEPPYGGVYCDTWQNLGIISDSPIIGYGRTLFSLPCIFKKVDGITETFIKPVLIRIANTAIEYMILDCGESTVFDHITQIDITSGFQVIPVTEL